MCIFFKVVTVKHPIVSQDKKIKDAGHSLDTKKKIWTHLLPPFCQGHLYKSLHKTYLSIKNVFTNSLLGQQRTLQSTYTIENKQKSVYKNACWMYSVIHISIPPIKELCSKMAPGEVGVSIPWWCHTLVLPPPGYWGLFLNLIIFS